MDGKRDHRSAPSYRDDRSLPDYIHNKIEGALEELRRHTQQKRREEEDHPWHSHSPYRRRHQSWRLKEHLRGEEARHSMSEAPRRDHHTEEYDPRGNEIRNNNNNNSICSQGTYKN
jgi:hypothetical protein